MTCDLTSGRLRGECVSGRAGIKAIYFAKYNDFAALTGITESGGEITDLGAVSILLYQFDLESNVGNFEETPVVERANGTSFISQTLNMTLFYVKPADLANLNNLKKGRWVVWTLDFEDKIRLLGRGRGMVATGGSDVSGAAPGDKKGLDLTLAASENDFSPFMADFTSTPFDNFANVTITSSGLGPELHVDANAASDPNGNEADATTGWTMYYLTGTGANVFESQGSVVSVGSYALHGDSTDTPTSQARFQKDFTVEDAATYEISFAWRHTGTGGGSTDRWQATVDGVEMDTVEKTDLTFAPVSVQAVASGTTMTIAFTEYSASNAGGVYMDNFSIRKVL